MCKVFSQLLVSFFRQKNKRTYLSLADTLMNLMYLCLVSFLLWLLAVSFWLLVFLYVMLKFAVKREQSQACLSYAEREQIEQS